MQRMQLIQHYSGFEH